MIADARPRRRATLAVAFLLLTSACGDAAGSSGASVGRIETTPPQLNLLVGETKAITARALDAAGNGVSRKFFWSTPNPEIVTVTQEGIVTAIAPGTTQIAVSGGGTSAVVPVSVAGRPAALVRVTPATSSVLVGQSASLTAEVLDLSGAVVEGRTVVWSSSDPAKASVNGNGVVTGIAPGNLTITAASGNVSGTALVSVEAVPVASLVLSPVTLSILAGNSQQLTADAQDASGASLPGRIVTWATSAPTVVTVSSTGFIIALAPGSATITATSEGKRATASVTVSAVPVANVSVFPSVATIAVNQSSQLVARLVDSTGAVLDPRPVLWSSDNGAIATVDRNGIVSAVATGTARISATSEGKSGSSAITVTPVAVASMTVTPTTLTLVQGATAQLTARALDAQGNPLAGRVVSWTSATPAVATVDANGLVTGIGAGSVMISVTSGGVRATATATVTAATVARVAVSPPTASLAQGGSLQLSATITDGNGATMAGKVATWKSSDVTVATVSSTGLLRAVSPGSATITATADGVSGTSAITVSLVSVANVTLSPATASVLTGRTLQLTLALEDSRGNPLSSAGRSVSWSSSATSVATVSATGVVTGATAGSATITATVDGKSGTAALSVTDIPVSSVRVSPASAQVTVGGTQQFTATALDAGGAVITGRATTWSSSNTAVATVSATGLVSALAAGTAQIVATISGVQGNAAATVSTVPVASVSVSPSSASLTVGGTQQFSATALDAAGGVISGRATTWSSSNTSIATVSASGLVSALSAGTAQIVATIGGVQGTASATVSTVPVASVSVSPATAQLTVGGTQQFSASALDAGGGVISGRATTWNSSNTAVATVSATGLVSALAAGTAQIVATISGVQGTASATVSTVPVASVSVSPSSASLTVGGTTQLTATAKDASGNTLGGRVATWSSDDNAVATVGASGLVTAVSAGSANITATIDGVSASAAVTATAVAVASVSVTPSTVSVAEGATTTLTATAKDAQGNTLVGRTLAWSSSDAAVATVSSSGVVTGVSPGTATVTATAPSSSGSGPAPAGSSTVTVTMAPVLSLTIAPANPTISVGGTLRLTATLLGALPNVPLPIVGRTLTWSVADPGVATISSAGVVTGVSAGSTTVTASAASLGQLTPVTATVTLSVAAPSVSGATSVVISPLAGTVHVGTLYSRQITAQVLDASGAAMPNEVLSWSTSDPGALSAASASAQGATLTAQGAPTGGVLVIASTGGATPVADTVTISTDIVAVANLSVAPTSVTLVFGNSQTVVATAVDSAGNAVGTANGNPMGTRSVSWSSDDTRTATVSATGEISALKRGNATVEARVGNVGPATVAVTVTNPAGQSVVNSVAVTPASATLVQGATTTFTAVALDPSGNPLPGEPIAWSVSAKAASLSTTSGPTTTITALDSGTVTVDATSSGKSGSATVRISLPPTGVDYIESIPPRAAPSVSLSSRSGRGSKVMFRVLSANGKVTGQPFQAVSSDPSVASVSVSGGGVTDSAGKGEFVVSPGRSARRGDRTTVTVTAGGKSLSWTVTIT